MSHLESDKNLEDLVAECHQLIVSGQISAVSARLTAVMPTQVTRKFRQKLAKICRRAGLINRGLRLLQPIVRNENKSEASANTSEICEYAVLLSRNGSVREALSLCLQIEERNSPEALLALSYCYTASWDYAKVIPLLEQLLALDLDRYSQLIGRVNLASAYLAVSDLKRAEEISSETIFLAKQEGASRLIANCHEIRGQVRFRKNDFAKARADFQRSIEIMGVSNVHDQLFARQWNATMTAIESNSVAPLVKFRGEAISRRLWESVREADLFAIKVRFDQDRLDHLVYGTSMPAYRDRISDIVTGTPSEEFIFGSSRGSILELDSGLLCLDGSQRAEGKIHQVLIALLRDFYAPRNIGTLFSELYPEEYFDINSSALRVHQLLFRTRHWLKANKLFARIEESEATYRLIPSEKFGVRLRLNREILKAPSKKWPELAIQFSSGQDFSAAEACAKLDWSRTTLRREIDAALSAGSLQKTGTGKATRYLIAASNLAQRTKRGA